MNKKLAQKAVKAALSGDWQNAIELNRLLLQEDHEDIHALNRLANAYAANGDIENAKKTAQTALGVDPSNLIANRLLEKWLICKGNEVQKTKSINPSIFIEEPGKTRTISLINLGDDLLIKQLTPAEKVEIKAHNHKVCVYTTEAKYIGRLPDDIAARMKVMLEMGNQYGSYIKKADEENVMIFVREINRCSELKDIPSFSADRTNLLELKKRGL